MSTHARLGRPNQDAVSCHRKDGIHTWRSEIRNCMWPASCQEKLTGAFGLFLSYAPHQPSLPPSFRIPQGSSTVPRSGTKLLHVDVRRGHVSHRQQLSTCPRPAGRLTMPCRLQPPGPSSVQV